MNPGAARIPDVFLLSTLIRSLSMSNRNKGSFKFSVTRTKQTTEFFLTETKIKGADSFLSVAADAAHRRQGPKQAPFVNPIKTNSIAASGVAAGVAGAGPPRRRPDVDLGFFWTGQAKTHGHPVGVCDRQRLLMRLRYLVYISVA